LIVPVREASLFSSKSSVTLVLSTPRTISVSFGGRPIIFDAAAPVEPWDIARSEISSAFTLGCHAFPGSDTIARQKPQRNNNAVMQGMGVL